MAHEVPGPGPAFAKPGKQPRHTRGRKVWEPIRDPYRGEDGKRKLSKFRKAKGEPRGRGRKNWLFLCMSAVVVGGGVADAMELIDSPNFIDFSQKADPDWSISPKEEESGWRFYKQPPQEHSLFSP